MELWNKYLLRREKGPPADGLGRKGTCGPPDIHFSRKSASGSVADASTNGCGSDGSLGRFRSRIVPVFQKGGERVIERVEPAEEDPG